MSMDRIEALAADHGVRLERDQLLARFTFFGVGGPMRALLCPTSMDALPGLLRDLRGEQLWPRILGCGTNLVASDEPFEQPIIYLGDLKEEPRFEDDKVYVSAGFRLPALVRRAMHHGFGGLEFAEGIPGTVGAALAINAGSFGGSIGDHVEWLRLVDADGNEQVIHPQPSDFAYRGSKFVGQGLILDAALRLQPDDEAAIRERLNDIRARRRASQPLKERSAGCIFKNPPGESAGRIIDELGLKGQRRGGAVVSEIHANFIVNRDGASAADILGLVEEVKGAVDRATGIVLEEEVALWEPDREDT